MKSSTSRKEWTVCCELKKFVICLDILSLKRVLSFIQATNKLSRLLETGLVIQTLNFAANRLHCTNLARSAAHSCKQTSRWTKRVFWNHLTCTVESGVAKHLVHNGDLNDGSSHQRTPKCADIANHRETVLLSVLPPSRGTDSTKCTNIEVQSKSIQHSVWWLCAINWFAT